MFRHITIAAIALAMIAVSPAAAQSCRRSAAHRQHIHDALHYHALRQQLDRLHTHRVIPIGPVTVSAGRIPLTPPLRDDIADATADLERLAREICLDLHYNYAHNPGFETIYSEAYQIYDAAKCLCNHHRDGDQSALRSQLSELNPLFHHVQSQVSLWTRHDVVQVGHLGVRSKLEHFEQTLHNLMDRLGVPCTPPIIEPPLPGATRPLTPPLLEPPTPPQSLAPPNRFQ